jgi:hypothetical protein
MTGDINVIHHPGLIARDIEATVGQYERLGFVFTPLSLHRIAIRPDEQPIYFGTGNRNAIFEHNFLEIVGVVDDHKWNQITKAQRGPFDLDERLRLYQGLHIMHFGADDIEVVRARFQREGIGCSNVARVQRAVDTPAGEKVMQAVAFHFERGANPEALMQVAQHLTPEIALQPRYMRHGNGARLLTEVIVCSADPEQLAQKYARYAAREVRHRSGLYIVDLSLSRIVVVDPPGLDRMLPGYKPPVLPFLAGFTVATSNMAMARDVLKTNKIEAIRNDERWVVAPKDACGCAVIFEEIGATR